MPGSNGYSPYKENGHPSKPSSSSQNLLSDGNVPTNQESDFKGNDDVIAFLKNDLKNNPQETLEQKKKRERMEKWEGIVSGISDAVSAASNLYFTSQYAPNMYDHRSSLSDKAKARWDKAKAERDAIRDKHLQYALKIGQLKRDDWNWRRQIEKDKIAAADRERAAALDDLNAKLMGHKITAAEHAAEVAKVKAKHAEALELAKVAREQAAAGANRARGNYYNNGGSGGKPGEFPWYDKDGKLHYAHSYGAMRQNAIMNGTWVEDEDKSTTIKTGSSSRRGGSESTTVSKQKGQGKSRSPKDDDFSEYKVGSLPSFGDDFSQYRIK